MEKKSQRLLKQNSYFPSVSILDSLVNSPLCSVAQKAQADCDETKLHQIHKQPLKMQSSNLPLSHLNTAANYLLGWALLQSEEHMMPKEKLLRSTMGFTSAVWLFLQTRSPHLLKGRKDKLTVKIEKWETASAGAIPFATDYTRRKWETGTRE